MTIIETAEQAAGTGPEKPRVVPMWRPRPRTRAWIVLDALRREGPLCSHQLADALNCLPMDASSPAGALARRGCVRRAGQCECRGPKPGCRGCSMMPATIWKAVGTREDW